MHVEKARAGAAAQVLVAATDGEIDVERCDIDGKHAQRVIDVEQHARADRVRRATIAGRSGRICPVWNITCDTTTSSVPA